MLVSYIYVSYCNLPITEDSLILDESTESMESSPSFNFLEGPPLSFWLCENESSKLSLVGFVVFVVCIPKGNIVLPPIRVLRDDEDDLKSSSILIMHVGSFSSLRFMFGKN